MQNFSKTLRLTIGLLKNTKQYLKVQAFNLFLLFLCILLTIYFGIITKNIIDLGIRAENKNSLLLYTGMYLISIILAFIFNILKDYITTLISESIIKDYRKNIFKSIKRINFKYLSDSNITGKILTGVINDVELIGSYYSALILQTLVNTVYVLATSIILIYWNYIIYLFCIIFIPIIYFLTYYFDKKIYELSSLTREKLEKLQAFSQEYIFSLKNVIFFNNQNVIDRNRDYCIDEMAAQSIKNTFLIKLSSQIIKYVSQLPTIAIYLFGGYLVIKGSQDFTLGKLLAIIFYAEMFFYGINTIGANIAKSSKSIVSLEKTNQILAMNYLKDIQEFEHKLLNQSSVDKIEIGNASLILDNKEIFSDLHCIFNKGDINVIYGENGSGKSSLLFVILGLYSLSNGYFKINDIVIEYPYTYGLSEFFACSFQENPCLNFLNINETLSKAKKHSRFNEFRKKLFLDLKKLETNFIGNYSGGEKQKISLLNTLCSDAEILVFDEPTNHLDKASIAGFLEIIEDLKRDKLLIIVTHERQVLAFATKHLQLGTA